MTEQGNETTASMSKRACMYIMMFYLSRNYHFSILFVYVIVHILPSLITHVWWSWFSGPSSSVPKRSELIDLIQGITITIRKESRRRPFSPSLELRATFVLSFFLFCLLQSPITSTAQQWKTRAPVLFK